MGSFFEVFMEGENAAVLIFLVVHYQFPNVQIGIVEHVHAVEGNLWDFLRFLVLLLRYGVGYVQFLQFARLYHFATALSPLFDLYVVDR